MNREEVLLLVVASMLLFGAVFGTFMFLHNSSADREMLSVVRALDTLTLQYRNGLLIVEHQPARVPFNVTVFVIYAYKVGADNFTVSLSRPVSMLNISGAPSMVVVRGHGVLITYKYTGRDFIVIAKNIDRVRILCSMPSSIDYTSILQGIAYSVITVAIFLSVFFLTTKYYREKTISAEKQ